MYRVVDCGKYLHVFSMGNSFDHSNLLGWSKPKNRNYYIVENNLINRMVLGLDINPILEKINWVPTSFSQQSLGLKDYQVNDLIKMHRLKSCLNRNPMGLGKTVETIAALKIAKVSNAVIIVPKPVINQWQEQFKQWWPEKYPDVMRRDAVDQQRIVITNYEQLLNNKRLALLKRFQWDYLVLDEAHRIKNPKSKTVQAIKQIPARYKMALTGTPILRKVDDLWSILNFLDWRYSGSSYWHFVDFFCEVKDDYFGKKIVGLTKNEEHVKLLQQLLSTISIYNNIQVAKGRTVETVPVTMITEQRRLYQNIKNLILEEIPPETTVLNGLTQLLRLQQVSSYPGQFIEGVPGPKFEWVLNLCQENPTEKIVVFSKFVTSVKALAEYLNAHGVKTVTYTGAEGHAERHSHLRSFKTAKSTQVIAGTIGALGTGVDGLQEISHTCVFLEKDWSPEILKQSEARLERMGQNHLVNVYYLECVDTIDKYVGKVVFEKAEDIRRLLLT